MIELDEQALICDLAETYGIYSYRSLPLKLVATFSAGLRENSRIIQKASGVKASQEVVMLAVIADRLGLLMAGMGGSAPPSSIADYLYGKGQEQKPKELMSFATPAEFDNYFYEGVNHG